LRHRDAGGPEVTVIHRGGILAFAHPEDRAHDQLRPLGALCEGAVRGKLRGRDRRAYVFVTDADAVEPAGFRHENWRRDSVEIHLLHAPAGGGVRRTPAGDF